MSFTWDSLPNEIVEEIQTYIPYYLLRTVNKKTKYIVDYLEFIKPRPITNRNYNKEHLISYVNTLPEIYSSYDNKNVMLLKLRGGIYHMGPLSLRLIYETSSIINKIKQCDNFKKYLLGINFFRYFISKMPLGNNIDYVRRKLFVTFENMFNSLTDSNILRRYIVLCCHDLRISREYNGEIFCPQIHNTRRRMDIDATKQKILEKIRYIDKYIYEDNIYKDTICYDNIWSQCKIMNNAYAHKTASVSFVVGCVLGIFFFGNYIMRTNKLP
jgi:hypothetical protein